MDTGAPAASDRAQPACLAEREAGGRASLLPSEDAAAAGGASPGDALCAGGAAEAGLAVKPNLNNGLVLTLPAALGAAPPGAARAELLAAGTSCPACSCETMVPTDSFMARAWASKLALMLATSRAMVSALDCMAAVRDVM